MNEQEWTTMIPWSVVIQSLVVIFVLYVWCADCRTNRHPRRPSTPESPTIRAPLPRGQVLAFSDDFVENRAPGSHSDAAPMQDTSHKSVRQKQVTAGAVCSRIGGRSTMEDTWCAAPLVPGLYFFSVYDGHRGPHAAAWLAQRLVARLRTAYLDSNNILIPKGDDVKKSVQTDAAVTTSKQKWSDGEIEAICTRVLEEMDQEWCHSSNPYRLEGSTAVFALVRAADHRITIGNVGDSRAVPFSSVGKRVFAWSTDHKPEGDSHEGQRLKKLGAHLVYSRGCWRVNGGLAVSRAFGNADLKPLVIATPTYQHHNWTDERFLLMGSDGLFDEVDNATLCLTVHKAPSMSLSSSFSSSSSHSSSSSSSSIMDPQSSHTDSVSSKTPDHPWVVGVCDAVDLAQRNGSQDNITALAVDLVSLFSLRPN